ncbi:MAG: DUF5606 domain-containing protein [Flavobacteriales bacterium]|nr:DUF5606 domain-containing protein [Flavobacteriales bacterium]MCB9363956.1 DUF5606 domain-containing protein [Flavobacteriales bacterium]
MNLKSIISITGKPGLYSVVSQTKNGLIVESVGEGKRLPVYASDKVSALEDISIYTMKEDMPLSEVYTKVFESTKGKEAIDHKSKPEELRAYLGKIIDFDQERVYNSDLKKLFQWFNLLVKADLLKPEEKEEKKAEKKAAKKAPAKKAAAKKTTTAKKPAAKTASAKATPKKAGGVKKG